MDMVVLEVKDRRQGQPLWAGEAPDAEAGACFSRPCMQGSYKKLDDELALVDHMSYYNEARSRHCLGRD